MPISQRSFLVALQNIYIDKYFQILTFAVFSIMNFKRHGEMNDQDWGSAGTHDVIFLVIYLTMCFLFSLRFIFNFKYSLSKQG